MPSKPSDPVTQLRSAIERSGLSARAYAEQVMVRDERTIRRWVNGQSPIPEAVKRWLTEHAP